MHDIQLIDPAERNDGSIQGPSDFRTGNPIARLLKNPCDQFSPIEKAALEQRLGRDLPGQVSIREPQSSGLGVRISFYLFRPHPVYPHATQELMVAKFGFNRTRQIDFDTLRIPAYGNLQQKGLGKTFVRNFVGEALDLQIKRINMRTEKVGSYFWLRCGGECAPDSRFLPNSWELKGAPEHIKERYAELMHSRDYWGIADLRDENKNYGYPLTCDIGWHGFTDLENPVALARLSDYVGLERSRSTSPLWKTSKLPAPST